MARSEKARQPSPDVLGPLLWRQPNAMQDIYPFRNRHAGEATCSHLANGIRCNLGWCPLSAASHVSEPSCLSSPAELMETESPPHATTPWVNCLAQPSPSPRQTMPHKMVNKVNIRWGRTLFHQLRKLRHLQKSKRCSDHHPLPTMAEPDSQASQRFFHLSSLFKTRSHELFFPLHHSVANTR